jgi:hypothetical protein
MSNGFAPLALFGPVIFDRFLGLTPKASNLARRWRFLFFFQTPEPPNSRLAIGSIFAFHTSLFALTFGFNSCIRGKQGGWMVALRGDRMKWDVEWCRAAGAFWTRNIRPIPRAHAQG